MSAEPEPAVDGGGDVGGDPVCWLHELCPECRAVPTPESPEVCWRCGAALPPRPAAEGRG